MNQKTRTSHFDFVELHVVVSATVLKRSLWLFLHLRSSHVLERSSNTAFCEGLLHVLVGGLYRLLLVETGERQ